MADKCLYENNLEVDGQIVYHERGFCPAVRFMDDGLLSSIDHAVGATRKTLGVERLDPSPGVIAMYPPTALTTTKPTGTSDIGCGVRLLGLNNVVSIYLISEVLSIV